MSKFRLPRKVKKKIRRDFYFYPLDEANKTYTVAFPRENQEDYDAFRKGILTNAWDWVRRKYKEK